MERVKFSLRYSLAATKLLDGKTKGSSILWAERASKGFGHAPHSIDAGRPEEPYPIFDYSSKTISTARKLRSCFYERILSVREIPTALKYSPVAIDVAIFSSIWNDLDGVVTFPDEDDEKLELTHVFTVYGHNKDGLLVDSGWSNWGKNRLGFISFEYLEKYFINAFVSNLSRFVDINLQREIYRRKILINKQKWYENAYVARSQREDPRGLLNIEINTSGGLPAGWLHLAHDPSNTTEILELFVLPEYRGQGIGSYLLERARSVKRTTKVVGYISGYDLGDKEEKLRDFFLSNGFLLIADSTHFYDCRYRIEKLETEFLSQEEI